MLLNKKKNGNDHNVLPLLSIAADADSTDKVSPSGTDVSSDAGLVDA